METLYCTTVGTELEQLEKLLDEVSYEDVPNELKTKLNKALKSLVSHTDVAHRWVGHQLLSRAVAKYSKHKSYEYLNDIYLKYYSRAGLSNFDLTSLVFYEADAVPILQERKLRIKELKKLAEKNEKASQSVVCGISDDELDAAFGSDF